MPDARWDKYRETSRLLHSLFEVTTEIALPSIDGPDQGYLGDRGLATVAHSGMAIWLLKNASSLFEQIASRMASVDNVHHLSSVSLADRMLAMLRSETQYLDLDLQRKQIAQLMVSLGIALLPPDATSSALRELFELQFESSSGRGWEAPLMRWALDLELNNKDPLERREESFQALIDSDRATSGNWQESDLNDWAYFLLRLELWRSATPIAKRAVEMKRWSGSLDTYGWALFYEKQYQQAEAILAEALAPLPPGNEHWCEVLYHRVQVAFWSRRLSDARALIDELQTAARSNRWALKATEILALLSAQHLSPLRTNGDFEYDVAVSFAGEDRRYADELARALTARGLKVFYDDFERSKLWGEDLYAYLSDVYRTKARFCLILVSRHYARKRWTNLERRAAQARAFEDSRPYLLPIVTVQAPQTISLDKPHVIGYCMVDECAASRSAGERSGAGK